MFNQNMFLNLIEPQFSKLFSYHMKKDILFKITKTENELYEKIKKEYIKTDHSYFKLSSFQYNILLIINTNITKQLSEQICSSNTFQNGSGDTFIERYVTNQINQLIISLFKKENLNFEVENNKNNIDELNTYISQDIIWHTEISTYIKGLEIGKVGLLCPQNIVSSEGQYESI